MKILIYGAGVLGSHLAHVLHTAGHDVTILARGNRLEALKGGGLKIRHYLQRRTTVDEIKVTDRLGINDEYDLVFIVMQYQQTDKVLPYIAENLKTKNYAFIGNNPFPEKTAEFVDHNSSVKKNLYFGFFMAAGRIENDCVIPAHIDNHSISPFVILTISGSVSSHLTDAPRFSAANLAGSMARSFTITGATSLDFVSPNMDAVFSPIVRVD